ITRRTDPDVPRLRPAQGRMPGSRGRADQLGGTEPAAVPTGQAFVHFYRSGLFEGVDDRVLVGAECEGRAGLDQRGGRPDAVAEVSLGRRAKARGSAGFAQASNVVGTEVG